MRNVRQNYGVQRDNERWNVGVQSAAGGCTPGSGFGCCSLVGPNGRVGDKIMQYLSEQTEFGA